MSVFDHSLKSNIQITTLLECFVGEDGSPIMPYKS